MYNFIIFLSNIRSAYYTLEKNMFVNDRSTLLFIERCYDCMSKTRNHHLITYQNIEYIKEDYIYKTLFKEHKKVIFLIIKNLWYDIFKFNQKNINNKLILNCKKIDGFSELYDNQVLQFFAKFNNKDFSIFIDSFLIVYSYYKNELDNNFDKNELFYSFKQKFCNELSNMKKIESLFSDIFKLLQILEKKDNKKTFLKSFLNKFKYI
ncbi:hypothetical protein NAPIS_ORF01085 [Vairimorpha apis BRL 01]|uniref:Uncharacterized protein n=1 Tax=Vairimorpha apis BRL 01 TaxID=1037528 RepID=T0MK11_9MICR|nr:hypothetical protein NAPIS_ORF01085 [Vairimorpha apis BRL 01]